MNPISDDDLHWLLTLLEEEGLAEIEVHDGEVQVVVRAASGGAEASSELVDTATEGSEELADNHIPVLSPVAGVFYRASSPDAEPLVEVGDLVKHGDTVGIVEAMKLFNEVPAPAGGVIVGVVAENGQRIEADELLMMIEKQG